LKEIRRALAAADLRLNGVEAYQLVEVAKATAKISGDMAEVGVYRGASARLLCDVKGSRRLHLFDTLE